MQYDEDRSSWLKERGFAVARYWNFQVNEDAAAVAEDVFHRIQALRGKT